MWHVHGSRPMVGPTNVHRLCLHGATAPLVHGKPFSAARIIAGTAPHQAAAEPEAASWRCIETASDGISPAAMAKRRLRRAHLEDENGYAKSQSEFQAMSTALESSLLVATELGTEAVTLNPMRRLILSRDEDATHDMAADSNWRPFMSRRARIKPQTQVMVLAIDPDTCGAIAVASWCQDPQAQGPADLHSISLKLYDMPVVLSKLKGKKKLKSGKDRTHRWIDVNAAKRLVQHTLDVARQQRQPGCVLELRAYIESPPILPSNGSFSRSSSQYSMGTWHGLLSMAGFNACMVPVRQWKKDLGLHGVKDAGDSKDLSRQLAMTIFPDKQELLSRKKDHGRAEALLIAAWALGCGASAPIATSPGQLFRGPMRRLQSTDAYGNLLLYDEDEMDALPVEAPPPSKGRRAGSSAADANLGSTSSSTSRDDTAEHPCRFINVEVVQETVIEVPTARRFLARRILDSSAAEETLEAETITTDTITISSATTSTTSTSAIASSTIGGSSSSSSSGLEEDVAAQHTTRRRRAVAGSLAAEPEAVAEALPKARTTKAKAAAATKATKRNKGDKGSQGNKGD